MKAFADDSQKSTFALERVETIVGKGENAGYQHFPKGFFLKVSKTRHCMVMSSQNIALFLFTFNKLNFQFVLHNDLQTWKTNFRIFFFSI